MLNSYLCRCFLLCVLFPVVFYEGWCFWYLSQGPAHVVLVLSKTLFPTRITSVKGWGEG